MTSRHGKVFRVTGWTSWLTNSEGAGDLEHIKAHVTTFKKILGVASDCNRTITLEATKTIPVVSGNLPGAHYTEHGSLRRRHNERDGVSNHQWLLKRLFRRRSKETSKLRVTGFCAGNSPVTGEFPAQMASNAENVSIRWRHHVHLLQHG